jgi:hypothetical protein
LQQEIVEDYEYDGGNSSSRLFERSRIKALAGQFKILGSRSMYVCNVICFLVSLFCCSFLSILALSKPNISCIKFSVIRTHA